MKRLCLKVVACIFFAAPSCFGALYDAWTWRNPSPTGNTLTAVAYGDGTFVAVDNSGCIFTSINGINWAEQFIGTNALTGVCFGNDYFVAVGGDAKGNGVAVWWADQGGNPWQQTSTGAGFLNAVAYDTNDNIFTAVGVGGAVATSVDDGKDWTSQNNPLAPNTMNGIAWGADYSLTGGFPTFVAVGNSGAVYYSPDGVSWTNAISSSTAYPLRAVAYATGTFSSSGGYGYFVAVGDSVTITTFTASDVERWAATSTTDFGSAVTYGNGAFVSVDNSHLPGTFISTNNGYAWSLANSTRQPPLANGITYGNGTFVSVGAAGLTATSSDASNWTVNASAVSTQPLTCGAFRPASTLNGGNLFVVGGGMFGGSGVILTSPDGSTWTWLTNATVFGYSTTNVLENTTPGGFVYVNNKFVGVGTEYNGFETGVALFSSDGINWMSTNIMANFGFYALNAITYGHVNGIGTYVAVGSSGAVPHSTDAVNWTSNALATTSIPPLNGVTYGNGKFVAVGGSGLTAVSSDAVNWTTNNYSALNTNLNAVVYGNGLFVAVGGQSYGYNAIFTSTDGLNWKQQYYSTTFYPALSSITYANDFFIADGGGGGIFISVDGTNWTEDVSGTINNFSGIIYGDNQILALGASGTILASAAPPPATYNSASATYMNGTFSIPISGTPGQTAFVQASQDLINWSTITTIVFPPSGLLNFSDNNALSSHKYYRVIFPP